MPMEAATVRRIARLARLRVDDAELERLGRELGGILGWIAQLEEVDVEGVTPLTGAADVGLRLRDDVVTEGAQAERVLSNAPERLGSYFTVPKVVE